ncbi:SDR family oxidoreductase [soil metagenome]|nr:SDR family oxidoreductase [Trueperaceae bacterium]
MAGDRDQHRSGAGRELEGKVVVVTGGASGNGRAIALACAEEGAHVVIADLRESPREGGVPTALLAREQGVRSCFVPCDVTRLDDLDDAMEAADTFGGIDVMVNNAGILLKGSILDATEEAYDRLMGINVKGVYFGSQAAARRMVPRGGGVIVNLSSIAGMRGTAGYGLYNASKGAVRLLSMGLADELGPSGVRVNALHPGIIDTQMNVADDPVIGTTAGERYLDLIPLRRWGRPSDVAQAVVFLASDRSAYITGASLVVDGGYLRT